MAHGRPLLLHENMKGGDLKSLHRTPALKLSPSYRRSRANRTSATGGRYEAGFVFLTALCARLLLTEQSARGEQQAARGEQLP